MGLLQSDAAVKKNASRLDGANKMIKKLEGVNLQIC